jgi:serine/threonine-protein kinase
LDPHRRLGPYEILAPIGRGGMGEVYRARDTRLDRTVAIKILPSTDPERRARFEREARAIAALQHPHICTLHDVGSADGTDFLVMEYLEGDTLAERIARGPLPLDQALRIAFETTDALARAHAAGIVHRDLKPANIMLTKAGVKLLDFGIAKVSPLAAGGNTMTRATPPGLTEDGAILGTVQYMAPEQLEGKPADARSDVFALGALLYEMIAGRPPFAGQSQATLIVAIMGSTPAPLTAGHPMTPAAVDRLVMTCLAKLPDDRWQSTQDLLRELRWLADPASTTTAGGTVVTRGAPPARRGRAATLAAAGLVLGALIGGGAVVWMQSPARGPASPPLARFAITLPAGETLASADNQNAGAALDISPDGSKVAYITARAGHQQLALRTVDRLEPAILPGTDEAGGPFFSPDGEWIGFFAGSQLKKISVAGGAAINIASVPPVARGATWAPDGAIYLTPTYADAIYKVPASGGLATALTSLGNGESNHLLPHVLPGGNAFVFTVWTGGSFDEASVWLWTFATGQRRKLIDAASNARYASTGHLVFARGGALLAVPFDLARLEVTGGPLPVADNVLINPANGTAEFAVSSAGTLVYAGTPASPVGTILAWVDRTGHEERIADIPAFLERPRLSPDGRRIAVERLNDIWVYDLTTGAFRRVTFQGVNQYPVWSRDAKQLTFNRAAAGKLPALFTAASDGSGQADAIVVDEGVQFPSDWTPNGRTLVFDRVLLQTQAGNWDILSWTRGEKAATPIVNGPFNEFGAVFSPDGRWLAYVSEESGRREVYVRPYPGPGTSLQISSGGGDQPRWSRDGKELFFYAGITFMHAQVTTAQDAASSKPARMFDGAYRTRVDEPGYPSYDVSLDGRRFLMLRASAADSAPTRLNVVLNWFEELKRRTK